MDTRTFYYTPDGERSASRVHCAGGAQQRGVERGRGEEGRAQPRSLRLFWGSGVGIGVWICGLGSGFGDWVFG